MADKGSKITKIFLQLKMYIMREDAQYIRIGIKLLKNGNWEMKNALEIKIFHLMSLTKKSDKVEKSMELYKLKSENHEIKCTEPQSNYWNVTFIF